MKKRKLNGNYHDAKHIYRLMNRKDQLTPEEYKRLIHMIIHFQLGSRVNDFKTIKAKLKRQLASIDNK